MARTATKSTEAVSQLATLPERVSVVEVEVRNLNEKVDDLKVDVKDMHDCLDRTRDSLIAKLDDMTDEYRTNAASYYAHANKLNEQQTAQHTELAGKIKELEKIKAKYTMYSMAAISFLVGAGLLGHNELPKILKFLGL
jgi:predicted RNase H-like nuclease (RuvC/YqgF family)